MSASELTVPNNSSLFCNNLNVVGNIVGPSYTSGTFTPTLAFSTSTDTIGYAGQSGSISII